MTEAERLARGQAEELDERAARLGRRLKKVYSDAVSGMEKRLAKELEDYEAANVEWKRLVDSGERTAEEYEHWKRDEAAKQDHLRAIGDQLARDLVDADKIAAEHVNQLPPQAFADGANLAEFEVAKAVRADPGFTLYDKGLVADLVEREPNLLPGMEVDEAKDMAWNSRHVTSSITQGILRGQSIDAIADGLKEVAGMDRKAAVRAARTAMTSAQNLGKVHGYRNAQAMGISVRKRWLATLDARTRSSHRELDGEERDLDKPFSNGLMYPGDPSGIGIEVYNCRCTMVAVVADLPYEAVERASRLGDMSYEDWKAGKEDG